MTILLRSLALLILFQITSLNRSDAQSGNVAENDIQFRAVAELGFLGVLDHKVQFGQNGTYFDYRRDGGQNVLFPVSRYALELEWKKKHTLILLYQPLRLESQVLLEDDLVVDGLTFPANTSVKLLYNFPFYRLSYLRELLPNNQKSDFGVGLSFQIRNATINFESADGSLFRSNRDIGPVPALKIRGKTHVNDRLYLELEADGMYAPISYLNGSDNEVEGAILDLSTRAAYQVIEPMHVFFNLRYLAGGAVGTSDDDEGPGDGYTKNWLDFLTVTTGAVYEW